MKFEGWVPNATGNLSFGVIGGPLKEGVHVRQHLRTGAKRWVLIAQTRINRDRLLPRWALPTLGIGLPSGSKRRDTTYVMLAASIPIGADPEGALEGILSCLVRPKQQAELALQRLQNTATTFASATEAQRHSQPFETPSDPDWASLGTKFTEASGVACKFRLFRSGKVFLEVTKYPDNLSQSDLIGLVNQLYYFLKDSVHTHYHHDISSDGIIELAPENSSPDWRHKTIRNLYREVLELRRSSEADLLSNAMGILAYAKTFDAIFHSDDLDIDGNNKKCVTQLPIYRDGIGESLQLRREDSQRENDKRHLDTQFVIAAFIAICAVLFGLYSDWPEDSISHKFTTAVLEVFSYYPLYYGVILAIMIPIYFANNKHSSGRRWRMIFDPIYRVLAWLPQPALVGVIIVICALSSVAFIRVTYLAYASISPTVMRPKPSVETFECRPLTVPPGPLGSPRAAQPGWRCSVVIPK